MVCRGVIWGLWFSVYTTPVAWCLVGLIQSSTEEVKDNAAAQSEQRDRAQLLVTVPETDFIPFNISNYPPPLSVPVSDDKESTDNYSFSGPNAESEG